MTLALEAIKRREEKVRSLETEQEKAPLDRGYTYQMLEYAREDCAKDVPSLLSELERARAVLAKVQWLGSQDACPICHGWEGPGKDAGHAPGCEMAALLSAAPTPARSTPQ